MCGQRVLSENEESDVLRHVPMGPDNQRDGRICKAIMTHHLGILFVGTGKYITLFRDFYDAFSHYLCRGTKITFFVFSDTAPEPAAANIVYLPTPLEPWPLPTLNRYDYFLKNAAVIGQCTHLMFANANLRPVQPICFDEFFDGTHEIFGTRHPGFAFVQKKWYQHYPGTFEKNKRSTAYAGRNPPIYFAGGLNGGTTDAWIRLCGCLSGNIRLDKVNHVNGTGWAIWHDESHINHYFNCRCRPRVLGPEYLYPEGWNLPVEKKIVVLNKAKLGGHDYFRNKTV